MTQKRKHNQIKRVISLFLALITLIGTVSVLALPTSAANYSTNYSSYNQPEDNDYARRGAKGSGTVKNEIKWIQAALNYLIRYRGLNASYLDVDGSFGSATEKTTKAFQKAYGLSVDGSFGPASIKKMKQVLSASSQTTVAKNFLQVDQSWSLERYGNGDKSALRDSGCGILSIVNAVYNLTGNFIQPTEVASWAHKAKLYNRYSDEGCYAEVSNADNAANIFKKAAEKYGNTYGFKYIDCAWGNASSSMLKKHIKNGGAAIVHVPGHFMTIVDYNEYTGQYFVLDSAPGVGVSYKSISRRNLTSADGDWKTVSQLSTGALKIDRFYLYAVK